jgi:hypothetical protein
MSTPREMQAGVPQGSVLSPILYNICIYINDAPQTPGVYLALFADDTCLYVTDRKRRVLLSENSSAVSAQWRPGVGAGILKYEDKTQEIYFSCRRLPPESHHTLTGQNIPFVNIVKYLSVIVDKKVTWRIHIEMIEAKAFRPFLKIYSLFKSE